MKLENQVVSLELSKQLKKAGYKQEGTWWWIDDWTGTEGMPNWKIYYCPKGNGEIVAPTVAELGEKLKTNMNNIQYSKHHKDYAIWLGIGKENRADTEANARAKMWLYLKKEKQ